MAGGYTQSHGILQLLYALHRDWDFVFSRTTGVYEDGGQAKKLIDSQVARGRISERRWAMGDERRGEPPKECGHSLGGFATVISGQPSEPSSYS